MSGGLLNGSMTVAAFDQLNVPLTDDNAESGLGASFGLDSIQLPFGSAGAGAASAAGSLTDWFSQSLDLLHLADLETIIGWFNRGLPATPDEIIRVSLDLQHLSAPLPPTVFGADFSRLLPDGFEGSIRLDRPEFGGQIVFGIDTSTSPFYVLTKPDKLISTNTSFEEIAAGGSKRGTNVGRESTSLSATFGVAATFNSTQPLIDGILQVPHAEGYLSSTVAVDFSNVSAETGKLRFHQLGELANLRIGFDGDPIDTFQAIVEASVTLPDLSDSDTSNPLANLTVTGAIHKKGKGVFFDSDEKGKGVFFDPEANSPWQFQLRTADLYAFPVELLATASRATDDDAYENNDTPASVTKGSAADLGAPSGRLIIGGQQANDWLALADAADWYRFTTTDEGDGTSFVQIDFDRNRGDLDLVKLSSRNVLLTQRVANRFLYRFG